MSGTARKRAASTTGASSSGDQRGKRQRLPATCEWILREAAYRSWKDIENVESPVLWIHGPPACGKTFLTQFILEDIQREETGAVTLATLSYFCDANSTPASVLRSFLVQLLQSRALADRDRAIITEFAAEVAPGDDVLPLDETYRLWDAFSSVIPDLDCVRIVIDGLDELPDNNAQPSAFDLPSRLADLARSHAAVTKLLLSSRTVSNIRRATAGSASIPVTAASVQEDLELFIQTELAEHPGLNPWRRSVCAAVLEQAEGNFIWAVLAVKKLAEEAPLSASLEDEEQFSESLKSIPASLDDLYLSVFSKQAAGLTRSQVLLRDQILRWILFAVRPLSLVETANAIDVESNAFIQDLEAQAIEVCGSLIKIENGVLKPVHHSLREFLLRDHPAQKEILSVERGSSNLRIAKSLVTYLAHPSFSSIEDPLNSAHFPTTHPLAEYASLYWVYHVSNAAYDTNLQASISQFFSKPTNWVEWADKLLPHFLPRSRLQIPPRPFNTARFLHLFILKAQLVSYFKEPEKTAFANMVEDSLRLTYESFVAQAQSKSGPESLEAVRRLLDLAEVYSWLPKYKSQGLAQLQAASFIISGASEPGAPDLGITVSQALADDYKRAGRYKDAQHILEGLISNARLSSKDPRQMFAIDSLGWVAMRLGDMEAAQTYLEDAKTLAAQIYGTQSPMTLRSKVTLAEVLGKLGRHEEAEALCSELKEQLRQHRDDGVPLPKDSISQLHTLGAIFMQEEKFREARDTYRVVVDDRRKIFGGEHGMTLGAEMQLGIALEKSGDQEGARKLFENLLPRQVKALGENHPDVKLVKGELENMW